ncbi:MAG: nucleoside triphosphate pyrophosphohydrolase [Proteobacteria bacterium]|nr:nucleoside triphosphate pyrophosphohydrolase [Pseudomonadota bacterium]
MSEPIERLLDIMARLRDPETGCPWDREQSFETIAPYTIEEAYEVADAIAKDDTEALKDELGDLLFQVVFYAEMARERGQFDFNAIATAIADKMERRHPHVFADGEIASVEAQNLAWEAHKESERAAKEAGSGDDGGEDPVSLLDGVALALPALMRAKKLQARAARGGFDWPDAAMVFDKIAEEIGEIEDEIAAGGSDQAVREEIGDLLFACVNLARKLGIEPETALVAANAKFTRRFHRVEALLAARGKTPNSSSLAEMDALWDRVKEEEKEKG